MGEEISGVHFKRRDFKKFQDRLKAETEALEKWFSGRRFSTAAFEGGFELEAWLTGPDFSPLPINGPFLDKAADPNIVPELARFNVEVNGPHLPLSGDFFSRHHRHLSELWKKCNEIASSLGAHMLMVGIPPTVKHAALTLENITDHHRYRALNEQVMRLRRGEAITLNIHGREKLALEHHDLTFEAAATSFQIHMQVPQERSVRFYNASLVASAPIVAVSANSPYLFGKDLWDETRIPLFEQAVPVTPRRVTFGNSYVRETLFEFFRENLLEHPVLLPEVMSDAIDEMHHLRLHNGTIWRWNRPLIGFDEERRPHLRIEHRVVPAGPTIADCLANAALYYGLVFSLGTEPVPPESRIPFEAARENFYAAARRGLSSEVRWIDGKVRPVRDLMTSELLPRAREGLRGLAISSGEEDYYLGILEERVRAGRNGAVWQRQHRSRSDVQELTAAYYRLQQLDRPVHTWET